MKNFWNNSKIINIIGKIKFKEKKEEGLCNDVFFVDAENGKFIIKIAKGETRKNELDKEINLINNLKQNINLPKIYLYQKETDFSYVIMEFIDGEKPKVFNDNILEKMALILKKIHTSQTLKYDVDFDKLIEIAKQNMIENKLDLDEFIKEGKEYNPKDILTYLKDNKPVASACLLHGDYRPKNMLIKENELYILDWGLSFVGDIYYDFAIIKWYFKDEEFMKFISYYGIEKLDKKRLEYNEWLSAFLNV